ncbi:hypothetical protein L1887_06490 [Cichorium endivia]|nr:hypothetical protein L1887_06490 [Cichorium endivia]
MVPTTLSPSLSRRDFKARFLPRFDFCQYVISVSCLFLSMDANVISEMIHNEDVYIIFQVVASNEIKSDNKLSLNSSVIVSLPFPEYHTLNPSMNDVAQKWFILSYI